MKFICTQSNLAQGVNQVVNAASTDSTLPILANILLKAQKGSVTLAATNLEVGITCVVGGRVETEGATTVPAKLFAQYVNSIRDDKIELTVQNNSLSIKSENTDSQMTGIDAGEFPLIPEVTGGLKTSIPSAVLQGAIKKTLFAAAIDNSRPEIAGVMFNLDKNQFVVAATDGYRLAEFREKIPLAIAKARQVIVPTKTMAEVARISAGVSGEIKMSISENQITFEVADVIISSRLIDGKYPDYAQIIPTKYGVEAMLKNSELLKTIKTSSVFSKTGVNDIMFSFDPEGKKLHASASSAEMGRGSSQIMAEMKGSKVDVIFNHRFIVDGINAIENEEIFFGISGQGGPGVIKSAQGDGYIYIVMPIKK